MSATCTPNDVIGLRQKSILVKNLSVTLKNALYLHTELIQNADDAGATEVTFILDHRDLPTLSPNLVDSRAHTDQQFPRTSSSLVN